MMRGRVARATRTGELIAKGAAMTDEATRDVRPHQAVTAPTTPSLLKASPMKYLDKAMNALRDLNLIPDGASAQDAPIVALLNQISDLDQERVVAITRTLAQAS